MESILRAAVIYLFLQLLIRLSGRRTMGEMTPFDLVLLLIISEATQQGLLGEDFSVVNAMIVITTLVVMDVGFSLLKQRSRQVALWMDGSATLLVADGEVLHDKLKSARIDRGDIMEAARLTHGLSSFSEIKHAVLEKSGDISIIPRKKE